MTRTFAFTAMAVGWLLSLSVCLAANVAFDSAADLVYDDGWQDGDNGGFGFGPWRHTLTSTNPSENGFFVGTSTANGDGDTNADGDIDRPLVNGRSWGTYTNNSQFAIANRSFMGGPLSVGQPLSLEMDNGFIRQGGFNGRIGFSLLNSGNIALMNFLFEGGDTNYKVFSDSNSGTTPGFTDEGLSLTFTLTDPDSFRLDIDAIANGAGVDHVVTGDFSDPNTNDIGITQIQLFNLDNAAGASFDAYFNSMAIGVPEPSSLAISCVATAVLVAAYCRRKQSTYLRANHGRL